jgi:hypothetical protein
VGNANGDGRQRDVPRNAPEQNSNGQDYRISGETDTMVNATSQRLEGGQQSSASRSAADPASSASRSRQTEPALGLCTNGPASGLDYAELYTACDNRTDELRLLGNGVVPATASKAFETLIHELQTKNDQRTN